MQNTQTHKHARDRRNHTINPGACDLQVLSDGRLQVTSRAFLTADCLRLHVQVHQDEAGIPGQRLKNIVADEDESLVVAQVLGRKYTSNLCLWSLGLI